MFQKLSLALMSILVIILSIEAGRDTKISNGSKLDVNGNGFDSVEMKFLGKIGTKIYYRSVGVGDKLPWLSNFQLCKSYGLEMGSIESEEEQRGINSLLNDEHIRLWTAGFRYSQNVFVWLSSGAEFIFTNWAVGEPNNLEGGENCVELHLNELEDIVWNDQRCDYRLDTLCEVDTNPGKKNNIFKNKTYEQ